MVGRSCISPRGVICAGLVLTTCAGGPQNVRSPADAASPGQDATIHDAAGGTVDAQVGPDAGGESLPAGMMLAGAAKADVTPQWPLLMACYEGTLVAEHYSLVEVAALVIGDGRTRLAFVTADIGDFSNALSKRIYDRLKPFGFSPEEVVLNASHNHTSPALTYPDDVLTPDLLDMRY